jgi:integrase/recombinase XerD
MARVVKPRKQRQPPDTRLQALLEEYMEHLEMKGFTDQTRTGRRSYLLMFERWAMERGLTDPVEITRPVLERYRRHMFHYRKKDGRPLSFSSQHARLSPLRMWFRWMTRQNYLLHNPASELELPRIPAQLPRVLTAAEAELVLQQPDVEDPVGMRDRAMLEAFYSTGMRRTELLRLRLYDVDRESGIATIREGKGKKDRVVPIGERAVAWLDKYLDEARPRLVSEPDDGTIFLTVQGEPFSPNRLSEVVRNYVEAARIGKRGACHLFRHTMATLMLEGGADIRFIQQMLGHSQLNTTQIYTHVSIRMLKQIHSATHPAAPLKRSPSDDQHAMLVQGQMWPGDPAPTARELFAALDAESVEEEQE